MAEFMLTEDIQKKWNPVLDAEGVAPIKDSYIRNVTTRLLEQTTLAEAGTNTTTDVTGSGVNAAGNWDPVLISLVRRTQPSLVAHELVGVQPMTGPTGLIFALRSNRVDQRNALGGGAGAIDADIHKRDNATQGNIDPAFSGKLTTPNAETLGAVGNVWNEMSFSIDKASVTAQTRALKANYTQELAHDLKIIHGIDAETELSNLLSGEITAELNRELVNTLFSQAITSLQPTSGADAVNDFNGTAPVYDSRFRFTPWGTVDDITGASLTGITTPGVFDLQTDADGRWEGEKLRSLIGVINRVSQEIALGTRRGMGNIIITNPVIAAALDSVSALDTSVKNTGSLNGSDLIGVSYAGLLLGRYKVFVDPYLTTNDILVGYKGSSAYDAGYYYCPYVPLSFMKTTHEETFQPTLGFKTRYGVTHNPFVSGTAGQNNYYRKFSVAGINAL